MLFYISITIPSKAEIKMSNNSNSENNVFMGIALLVIGFIVLIIISTAKYLGTDWASAGKFLAGMGLTTLISYLLYRVEMLRNLWFLLPIGIVSSLFPILNSWSDSKYPFTSLGKVNPNPEWYALWYTQILMLIIPVAICYTLKKFIDERY